MTKVRWLPPVLWMVAIFVVSNQPSTGLPDFGFLDLLVKKGGHFLAYALLAWLVQRAWKPGAGSWGWALVVTAVYAISDELHQTFIPGRFGSLADVLIDISGGLTALLISHYRSSGSPNRSTDDRVESRLSITDSTYDSLLTAHRSLSEVQSGQTAPADGP